MMTEDHDATRIVGTRLNDYAQPFDEFGGQGAVGLEEMFEDRRADGIVAGVERDDAPMVVLEAEKLARSPCGLPRTPSFGRM